MQVAPRSCAIQVMESIDLRSRALPDGHKAPVVRAFQVLQLAAQAVRVPLERGQLAGERRDCFLDIEELAAGLCFAVGHSYT